MRKGFTLVELVIVLAILVALGGIMMGAYPKMKRKEMLNTVTVNQEKILAGMERYKEITGSIPQTQADFEKVLTDTQFFESVPVNPFWTDNKNHPEKGWKWSPDDFSVFPIMEADGG